MTSAPTLTTQRLTLREGGLDDVPDSATMWADPAVVRFIGGRPFTPEEVWHRHLRYAGLWSLLGYGYWMVRETATGIFLGEVGFANYRRAVVPHLGDAPECGWVLGAAAQGRGFAREAVEAALVWADRHLEAPRTVCMIEPGHAASIHVAGRLGYRPSARGMHRGAPVVLFERPRAMP